MEKLRLLLPQGLRLQVLQLHLQLQNPLLQLRTLKPPVRVRPWPLHLRRRLHLRHRLLSPLPVLLLPAIQVQPL